MSESVNIIERRGRLLATRRPPPREVRQRSSAALFGFGAGRQPAVVSAAAVRKQVLLSARPAAPVSRSAIDLHAAPPDLEPSPDEARGNELTALTALTAQASLLALAF